MEGVNPNLIMFGVFGATLVAMLLLAAGLGAFGTGKKMLIQRLTRVKSRYASNRGSDSARRTLIYTRESHFDTMVKRYLPRPDELRRRLNQTGRSITLGTYAVYNVASVLGATVVMALVSGLSLAPALLVGLFLGLAIPHLTINRMIANREKKFTTLFPEAIDLIVRGLKSGLPVTESIYAVGREMDDPVGAEFRKIADDIRLGKTMNDALWSTTERLTTAEFKFFVISLSVQQETGGNLAETLSNLSGILRSRQQMRLKIKAMSSEGRASALIIGALPFIMFAIIMGMNPDYGSVLYTDPRAQIASVGSLIWMGIGMFMISKMISFEI